MKDLLRMRTSLSEEIENMLNDQIKMEAHASSSYLAMASWCDRAGFEKSADLFYAQSDEERTHMLKIFKYVSDLGGNATSPEITLISVRNIIVLKEVFETFLEQEIAVTKSFNRMTATSHKQNDFTTVKFLEWFLNEQIEEEYTRQKGTRNIRYYW